MLGLYQLEIFNGKTQTKPFKRLIDSNDIDCSEITELRLKHAKIERADVYFRTVRVRDMADFEFWLAKNQ